MVLGFRYVALKNRHINENLKEANFDGFSYASLIIQV